MSDKKVITINDRIPSLKEQRKQRANRRLLFFLGFFFILLLLMIYFQSPLSNITSIEVTGNVVADENEIIEASGLNEGDSIWNLHTDSAISHMDELKEVASSDIHRKLPNTVEITITEYPRVGYVKQEDGYYPMLESGALLDVLPNESVPADAPVIVAGAEQTKLERLAQELGKTSDQIKERISEILFVPTEEDPLALRLYMNDGLTVQTSINNFSEWMTPYPSIAKEVDPSKNGILHMKMSPYFEDLDYQEEEEEESETETDS
ncbi:cell division protein FtsQ/DivIB [Alkalicoccobacillus porphyridii]|uniref:Cell division protein DivIB n=1 Tax=Alkalicoccobacillus porphyridii TaxID=2597270 RepID=A0A553ZXZ4_9BACI|nr:FtsQ-type POTRA domain-containing protein [Alkalicoccobacillus porphyridii]TSB46328.1 FtsQ-type POTRA domain-containing protein [Alkalicoccobacillus porphyridii]